MILVLFRFSQKQVFRQKIKCKVIYLGGNGRKMEKGKKAIKVALPS